MYFSAGIGLVFFGIKVFTQSLQALTGSLSRVLINKRSSNIFSVGFIGFFIALLNFSSMGMAYMTLGYVNAGLMSFVQSIQILLAAQVALSSAAWFFAFVDGSSLIYVLLAMGFVSAFFGSRLVLGQTSKTFFSVGLILLGMELLGKTHTGLIEMFTPYASIGLQSSGFHQSYFLVCILALFFTCICRNKLLLVALCYAFMAGFELSPAFCLAIVMGLSLGASIPQLVISRNMSTSTKRTSYAYLIIEIFIFILCALFLNSILSFEEVLFSKGQRIGFAAVYTLYSGSILIIYNILRPLFFEKLIRMLIPEANYKEAKKLELQGSLADITTSLAFDLIEQELKKMSAMVEIQLDLSRTNLVNRKEDKVTERRVSKYEKITDNIDLEISKMVEKLMQRSLQEFEAKELQCNIAISDELESIADSADELLLCAKRLREQQSEVPAELMTSLRQIGSYIQDYYIQFFNFFMGGEELSENNSRLQEKIEMDLEALLMLQKDLLGDNRVSPVLNQSIFETYRCFDKLLEHIEKFGLALIDRSEIVQD